jgi:hypothetical protein
MRVRAHRRVTARRTGPSRPHQRSSSTSTPPKGSDVQVDYDLLSTEAKQLTRIRREFKGIEN